MEQKSLSNWLKGIIIGVGICGAIGYFSVVPGYGQSIIRRFPEFSSWYLPWLVVILLTGIPIYIALYQAWKIAVNIGQDRSFCMENAAALQWIARLALIDVAYFFLANVVMVFLSMNHAGVLLLSLLIALVGVAISVCCAGLSHLVLKAAKIQEENELTI
jgi:hypothetical protein